MARLEDKIAEIADASVRQAIAEEVAKLKKRTRFGLVFEEHQPEVVPIHDARIKRGERVALRTGSLTDIWRVLSVRDGQAHCEKERGNGGDAPIRETFDERQLIVVRRMGEAIYPALTPLDAVKNGDPTQPHHILIEADNYHALQLLLFPYEGKVDCIYIDPPYNTGDKSWKYNNDFVDANDAWRHSKWLAMMQRRLLLAKRLLNPTDSVLIVTIDEKEYLRLGMLLQQTFPDASMQMISTLINSKGTGRANEFRRVDEYIYFLWFGAAKLGRLNNSSSPAPELDNSLDADELDEEIAQQDDEGDNPGSEVVSIGLDWQTFRRRDLASRRGTKKGGPRQFYPIYVNAETGYMEAVGDPLPHNMPRTSAPERKGCVAVFPIP